MWGEEAGWGGLALSPSPEKGASSAATHPRLPVPSPRPKAPDWVGEKVTVAGPGVEGTGAGCQCHRECPFLRGCSQPVSGTDTVAVSWPGCCRQTAPGFPWEGALLEGGRGMSLGASRRALDVLVVFPFHLL